MKNNKPKIKYFDLYGSREKKYEFLNSHSVENTEWKDLELKKPHFWFVPKDLTGEEKYNKFISIKDIFEKYNAGIATGKDDVLVDFDKQSLIRKLSVLDKNLFEITMQNYGVKKELVDRWHKELKNKNIGEQIKPYNYRPFDNRFTIYNSKILQRARTGIMNNFLRENLGIVLQNVLKGEVFTEVFITNHLTDKHLIGHQSYIFPLFIHNQDRQNKIFNEGIQKTNFSRNFCDYLAKKDPPKDVWEIFYYIYGVLYSNIYRKKYNEFLKIDFPRIPFTKDAKIFSKMSGFGKELAGLHLLKSEKLENPAASFPISGNSRIKKREYREKEKRVYINEEQYFEGIEPEIWNYCVGGYQVLDKWLKDRISGTLSAEDVEHYLKIITALKCTIEIQKQIDEIYPEIDRGTIENRSR